MPRSSWRRRPLARSAFVGALAVSVLGLTACGDDPADSDAEAGVYDGGYDPAFVADIEAYAGEVVTLSADVNLAYSPVAFTIAAPDVEPLLVISSTPVDDVRQGDHVAVTGVVREELDLPAVEEELGIDLEEEQLRERDHRTYLVASTVEESG